MSLSENGCCAVSQQTLTALKWLFYSYSPSVWKRNDSCIPGALFSLSYIMLDTICCGCYYKYVMLFTFSLKTCINISKLTIVQIASFSFRFLLTNCMIIYLYTTSFQNVDDEEYGGMGEILKEGMMSSFATFMVSLVSTV